jgi:carboxymethylenebutenolidase
MPQTSVRRVVSVALIGALAACAHRTAPPDEHTGHGGGPAAPISDAAAMAVTGIPPGAAEAQARLAASPRHGEWAMIPAGSDSVRAWVVYPERSTKAPVVVVVHEIFGLSTWVRAVADQLAAEGFIAIAPDFLTGKLEGRNPDAMPIDTAIALVRTLKPEEVQQRIDAAAQYAMSLPAALPRYGVVGFCWGGSIVFAHAVHAPALGAAVVYYGGSPPSSELTHVRAPVLGLYGGNDARVNATIPPADSAMRALGKTFEPHIFAGAGHGFLRAQDGQNGANLTASTEAWPLTIAWFRRNLGA